MATTSATFFEVVTVLNIPCGRPKFGFRHPKQQSPMGNPYYQESRQFSSDQVTVDCRVGPLELSWDVGKGYQTNVLWPIPPLILHDHWSGMPCVA